MNDTKLKLQITGKKIVKSLFPALLLTSFYSANSMLFTTVNFVAPYLLKKYRLSSLSGPESRLDKLIKYGYINIPENFDHKNSSERIEKLVKYGYTEEAKRYFFSCSDNKACFIKNLIKYGKIEEAKNYIRTARLYSALTFRHLYEDFNDDNNKTVWAAIPLFTREMLNKSDGIDTYINTPLLMACEKKDQKTAKLLIENGADYSIFHAIMLGNLQEVMRFVIDENVDVNRINGNIYFDNQSLIELACNKNNLEIVKFLLPYCTRETIDHNAPIIGACTKNNLEIARLLLKHGANINQAYHQGNTAFSFYALTTNNSERNHAMARLILEHNPKTYRIDRRISQFDLEKAQHSNNQELIRCINLKLGYDNAQNLQNKELDTQNKINFIFDNKANAPDFEFLVRLAFGISLSELEKDKNTQIESTVFGELYKKLSTSDLEKIFGINITNKNNIYEFVKRAAEKNYFYYDKDLIEKNIVATNLTKKLRNRSFSDCIVNTQL